MAAVLSNLFTGESHSNSPVTAHNSQYYLETGQRCLKEKKFSEAIAIFKHVSETSSTDARVWLLLAQSYFGNGLWKEAEDSLTRALKLKPSCHEAHYFLGIIHQEKTVLERAIAVHRKSVLDNPTDPKARYFLGLDLLQRGLLQEAMQSFQKAIELKPDYADAYFQLGAVFIRNGKLDWAITQFEKAMLFKPGFVDAALQIAKLHFQKSQFEDAAKHLQKLLELHPQQPELNFYMGESYRLQGRWMDAISSYQTAVLHRGSYVEAWANLAQACRHSNQWEEARLAAQQTVQLDPQNAEAHYILGLCALQKKQGVNAQNYFQKYLHLAPNGPDSQRAHYYLVELEKGSMVNITS